MKKLSFLLLLVLLIGGLVPASAQDIPHPYGITYPIVGEFGENHTFTLDRDGLMTVSGSGPMVCLGGEFPWYVAAGDRMYDFRNQVLRLVVGPGTTTVGENAFAPFYELKEVTLPQGIVSIENGAFTDCKALETIDLPEGLTTIGGEAFRGCEKLSDVKLPATLTSLGGFAFCGTALDEVKLPAGLTYLGYLAFYDTPWYLSQPDGMIYLNGFAYAYKGDMPENTEITLKPGTKRLCVGAFDDHPYEVGEPYQPHLTGLILPDSIAGLEPYQFQSLAGLRRLVLPKGITSLPDSMCQDCCALEEAAIPAGVTAIGDRAFSDCYKLNNIAIPDGVRTIGESAFSDCKSLTAVTIPDSVTELGSGAFYGCEALTEATLGEGITVIPNGAFNSCAALKEIAVPDSVTAIEPWAFGGCAALATVRIPASVKTIANGVFPERYGSEEEITALTVLFAGTEEQWKEIKIAPEDNGTLLDANVVFEGAPQVTDANRGDIDGDGRLSSADARLALRASVKLEHFGLFRTEKADYDRDGNVTPADARLILRASVGLDAPETARPAARLSPSPSTTIF